MLLSPFEFFNDNMRLTKRERVKFSSGLFALIEFVTCERTQLKQNRVRGLI